MQPGRDHGVGCSDMPRALIAVSLLLTLVLGAGAAPPLPPSTPPASTPSTDTRARDQQSAWRTRFGTTHYRYMEDAKHRLVFATCLDLESHEQMLAMLSAQADQQAATLFESVPDVEVFIAVARPSDAKAVIGGSETTEGMYEHPMRRLVASDIGIVLRHEFTHLMHFGHMERLGQPHLLWVQEGIACLYEDYQLQDDGAITFTANLRHNQARSQASARTFMPLAKLITLSPDEFMAKSQQLYPQVRSLFEFIADSGKLRKWYRQYTETFDKDRTGKMALEEVFGMPLSQIETEWRTWVLKRPAIQISIPTGTRSIGIEVAGATDGVQVRKVERKGIAARAGLKVGDVVVAVDGANVRSPREFIAALAKVKSNTAILTLRRGDQRMDLPIEFPAANSNARAGVLNYVSPLDGNWSDIRRKLLSTDHFQTHC